MARAGDGQQSVKTALVTGGGGFIGSHIVRGLLDAGWKVRVVDDLSGCGSWRRMEGLKVDATQMALSELAAKSSVLQEVDAVFHMAAKVSVPESVKDPLGYHQVDATDTLGLLEACLKQGVRRLIYASTSAIYGDLPEQPKRESHRGLPISPYGVAKYAGELYVGSYAKLHNMQTVALRYFNVFGEGQDPKSQYGAAIPSIVCKIVSDERPTIYGDGEQTRDFCHVSNVVRANLLAAECQALQGQALNIACGKRVSVNMIVQKANQLLGKNVQSIYEPPRAGDVRDSLADISEAQRVLGYEPQIQFDEGLERSIQWYVKHFAGKR